MVKDYNHRSKIIFENKDQQYLWLTIKNAIENPKFKWRTVKGLSEETGLPVGIVETLLVENEDDIIQSRIPSRNGRDLFTTRKHYRETNSFFQRFSESLK